MGNKFWRFRMTAQRQAELLLYGDIADKTWWGDEVTPKEFTEELNALGDVDKIVVRINSGGGDVFAAQTIGNQLEQHPAYVIARIDGLCASSATVIACHCDKVEAGRDTSYMIHPAKVGTCGYMDAEELRQYQDALRVIRENIVDLYAKKTGREKTEVAEWMDSTSWYTAQEAKDKGFVDEIVNENENVVVENRNGLLFVNAVGTALPFDQAPKFVQDRKKADFVNHSAEKPERNNEEEENVKEIKTADALREAYPELVDEIVKTEREEAVNAERQRIRDIEEMTVTGSEETARKAKFETPVSAADFAKDAMRSMKTQGAAWLAGAKGDAKDIGEIDRENTGTGKPKDKGGEDFLNALKTCGKR